MTDSDVRAVPVAAPERPETWKPIPGHRGYEASDKGQVRSVDRVVKGRSYKGKVLSARASAGRDGKYLLVNIRTDDGEVVTLTVHKAVLLAHAGPCPEGLEACHGDDDPLNNWWPENLSWGTHAENVADRMRNNPAAPKPPRYCIRCSQQLHNGGRRCHDCAVDLGVQAADLLTAGATLADACDRLDYPSADGLHNLAVKYGGYAAQPPVIYGGWSQRVMATLRHWHQSRQG